MTASFPPPDVRNHPRPGRHLCAVEDPSLRIVDQTTARLVALNETLDHLGKCGADLMQQSKQERTDRKRLRAEVYAEIQRLVAPEPEIRVATAAEIAARETAGVNKDRNVGDALIPR